MNNSADELKEIELKPTMDEYQLIWENTNDAIFILRNDGAVIQANPALTDILGWRLEEVEGYARPPFFMEDFTLENHQKQLDILRSGESIANFETQRKHKDGTIIDVLASYRAINKDHILAVAMYKDITEEKITKHKLGIAENCYRTLVEYSPDAILVQNDDSYPLQIQQQLDCWVPKIVIKLSESQSVISSNQIMHMVSVTLWRFFTI